ncbi:hypothetical protein [Agrobacterium pusense]|uniref:hypothetical protein n=1 Tax=Agrobacterium pusense TaxID=648995 RepID=UPI0022B88439|nr:hypothetical protein [Agrobacterium pusense]MCZ7929558.1 hypothetical protein [Agrobacterium pusense]
MNVIGYSKNGNSIIVEIDGVECLVPKEADDNRHRIQIAEWEAKGNTIPPYAEPPAPPPTVQDYQRAIQALVEQTAQSKQYDTAANLASYVASTVPVWAAEAQAFVEWRDNVWFYAYGELAKVQAGQREQPTVEQFLTEITPIAWPVA